MRRSMRRIACAVGLLSASGACALEGTVSQRSLRGPITGDTIRYNIYLPPGYQASADRYPVVYHLHGIGGDQGGPQNQDVPAAFERARAKGIIGPVIVVFPDGLTNSFWADARNRSKRVETHVIRELIPHVDAKFRTLAAREHRVLEGFSMGGFGAAEYAGKFPGLFRACVVYDGALLNWRQLQARHPGIAESMFGNDGVYFDRFSPWTHWAANAAVLRDGMPIRIVVGALTEFDRAFRAHLESLGIAPEYVETGAIHALPPLLAAEGENSIRFLARHLGVQPARTTTAPAPTRIRPVRPARSPHGAGTRRDGSARDILGKLPNPGDTHE